jgi:hypothetical protein
MISEFCEERAIKKTDKMLEDSGIAEWLIKNNGGLYARICFELRETAILMFKNQYLADSLRENQNKLFQKRNELSSKIGETKASLKAWEIRSKWILCDYEISSELEREQHSDFIIDDEKTDDNLLDDEITEQKKRKSQPNTNTLSRPYSFKYNSQKWLYFVNSFGILLLGFFVILYEYALKIGLSFVTIVSLLSLVSKMNSVQGIQVEWITVFAIFSGISIIQYVSWYVYNEFFYHNGKFFKLKSGKTIFVLIYFSEAFLGYEGLITLVTPIGIDTEPLDWYIRVSIFLASGAFVLINILFSASKAYKNKKTEENTAKILTFIESHKVTLISIIENMDLIDLYERRFQKYKNDFQNQLDRDGGIYDLINLVSVNSYTSVENKPISRRTISEKEISQQAMEFFIEKKSEHLEIS